jgi:methyl-accepting chemotaxis protein
MTATDHTTPRARTGTGFLGRLKVRTKILTALGLVGLVAVGAGTLAVVRMGSMNATAEALYNDGLLPLTRIDTVHVDVERTRRDVLNHAISTTKENRAKHLAAVRGDFAAFARDLDAYAVNSAAPDLADQVRAKFAAYEAVVTKQLMPAAERNDMAEVERIRDEVAGPEGAATVELINRIVAAETRDAKERLDGSNSAYRSALVVLAVSLAVGLSAAIAFGLLVSRSIVASVRRVTATALALGRCDLTHTCDLDSQDEFGDMGRGLDSAIENLRTTVTDVIGTAGALGDASVRLSAVSAQLDTGAAEASSKAMSAASAADQVNAGVQSVTAGAEQMSASITEIASNAGQAASVAEASMIAARTTTEHIAQLREASSEIGSVVALITSIAEQTNLLALNATIEAARAGEAGKGFAVVATEVKDLAQETAKATSDITARIEAIQTTSAGAAAAVAEIQAVIHQISEFTVSIASAVEEQSATTGDMSRALNEAATSSQSVSAAFGAVAEVTAATSDSASASGGAARDLSGLADRLNGMVAVFRV